MFGKKKDDSKLTDRDIGFVEDAFELCKNLTSIESHSFGSYTSSEDKKFIEIGKRARELRTKYLALITKEDNAQGWCISKHLCEISMRLQEIYTRYLSLNQIEEAKKVAKDAFDIYLMFLQVNDYDLEKVKTNSSA